LLPKKEILQKCFGNHVKELRLRKNLTQIDVSSRMNKDQQSLQRVESGNVSPSLYYLFELAEGLNIEPSELFDFKIPVKQKKK
jgi:transcriptional regulator with XRE-family HTH domain